MSNVGMGDLQAKAALAAAGWSALAVNNSGLEPLGRAILVEPYEPERTKGLIAIPDHILANERTLDVRVRVVAIGPVAWPDEPARCQPGDVVMVAKMSGFVTIGPKDGRPYRFVNDRDVFARVTKEADHG